jgi:hypothetical protein
VEDHDASDVTFLVVPSERVAVAVNWLVSPMAASEVLPVTTSFVTVSVGVGAGAAGATGDGLGAVVEWSQA